jgi:hypothetical protein
MAANLTGFVIHDNRIIQTQLHDSSFPLLQTVLKILQMNFTTTTRACQVKNKDFKQDIG